MKDRQLLLFTDSSVHFCSKQSDIRDRYAESKVMETSFANVKSKLDLMIEIEKVMQFPDYFGRNWDALEECMQDMKWLPAKHYILIIHDAEDCWKNIPEVVYTLIEIWVDSALYWRKRETAFHLVFTV
ncbi:barstar family protein [Oleidesulfovibrio alaskensis]|uniref:barstar family protein n=1 Tax=Oleidesulfovibrio alaskensis TaxID=58180 RepID=UPI001A419E6A|nr:barstar family protein [Oleidesulfovibrio alaskensis]